MKLVGRGPLSGGRFRPIQSLNKITMPALVAQSPSYPQSRPDQTRLWFQDKQHWREKTNQHPYNPTILIYAQSLLAGHCIESSEHTLRSRYCRKNICSTHQILTSLEKPWKHKGKPMTSKENLGTLGSLTGITP